jgi:cell division protein FtsI (penicillin-binding protein 3)
LEARKDILWRSYLIYLGMVVLGVIIFGKALYIQVAEGSYWRSLGDSLHLDNRELDAERGTIYSEDGRMLSSSIPYFDIYLDFGAEGVQEKNGARFKQHLDSLSIQMASILGGASPEQYKRELLGVFKREDRYYLLEKNINYSQYRALRNMPFISKYKNKNGFIFVEKEKRLTPYGLLAKRTIGLSREYIGADRKTIVNNVGLEKTYDSLLKGVTGNRLVRRVAGGAYVPVEGSEIEPENGKDIITTLDINIQDLAENALLKVMQENECTNGTCIVMEVKTGKIKAIANLGRQPDGSYAEDFNYAITRSEPGSTFKLVTMLAALEDQFINLNTQVNLEGGKWDFAGRTVKDSERHNRTNVSFKQAFELSSNVGMAKLAVDHYYRQPSRFISHLQRLNLHQPSGINLVGESRPIIPSPSSKNWSSVALPWMSFGYNIAISPLQTLMVYNAVANNGKMMKPYLVNAVMKDGIPVKEFSPVVINDSICSKNTLSQLRTCLEGVVAHGTAKSMQHPHYSLAGKTGTAQVANGNKGYTEHIYQSSFAGYFPAEDPKYSCIVVIVNKPFATRYYGSQIAGPVFSAIVNKLFTMDAELYSRYKHKEFRDTSRIEWAGAAKDFRVISKKINTVVQDSGRKGEWGLVRVDKQTFGLSAWQSETDVVPNLRGFGLRDALELLEKKSLQVVATGKGRVVQQSIAPGTPVEKGQTVYLQLGNTID